MSVGRAVNDSAFLTSREMQEDLPWSAVREVAKALAADESFASVRERLIQQFDDLQWLLTRNTERRLRPLSRDVDLETSVAPGRDLPSPIDFIEHLRARRPASRAKQLKVGDVVLPMHLHEFEERVEVSRAVIGRVDPDDGTSVVASTWRRTAEFVARIARLYWQRVAQLPPLPVITDGPEGSVDVVWRSGSRQILLNVPDDDDDVITASGIDTGDDDRRFRDSFRPSETPAWLLHWLTA
jgi:hypothetical protein